MIDPDDAPEDELGLYRDQAMDERLHAEDASQKLREMYVTLDGIADSHDIAEEFIDPTRSLQRQVETLKAAFEERAENVAELEAGLNERIAELDGEEDGDDA